MEAQGGQVQHAHALHVQQVSRDGMSMGGAIARSAVEGWVGDEAF